MNIFFLFCELTTKMSKRETEKITVRLTFGLLSSISYIRPFLIIWPVQQNALKMADVFLFKDRP